jgi:hypothetical protein
MQVLKKQTIVPTLEYGEGGGGGTHDANMVTQPCM